VLPAQFKNKSIGSHCGDGLIVIGDFILWHRTPKYFFNAFNRFYPYRNSCGNQEYGMNLAKFLISSFT
jgi:hypothetical protein